MDYIGGIGFLLFLIGASIKTPPGSPFEWVSYIIMAMGVACVVIWHMTWEGMQ